MHGVLTEFIRWKRSFPNGSVLEHRTILDMPKEQQKKRFLTFVREQIQQRRWKKRDIKNGHETVTIWSNDILYRLLSFKCILPVFLSSDWKKEHLTRRSGWFRFCVMAWDDRQAHHNTCRSNLDDKLVVDVYAVGLSISLVWAYRWMCDNQSHWISCFLMLLLLFFLEISLQAVSASGVWVTSTLKRSPNIFHHTHSIAWCIRNWKQTLHRRLFL